MKVTASVHKFFMRCFQQPRHKHKIGLVMSCAVADIDGAITNEMICVLVYLSMLRIGSCDCTQCSLMPMPIALLALMPIISIFLVMQMGITQIWCHQRVPGSARQLGQHCTVRARVHACMHKKAPGRPYGAPSCAHPVGSSIQLCGGQRFAARVCRGDWRDFFRPTPCIAALVSFC